MKVYEPSWRYVNRLYEFYSKIVPATPISSVSGHLVYNHADALKTSLMAKNLWYIDIRSAAQSVCRAIFDKTEPEFVNEIDEIPDKKDRHIFITNSLKNDTDEDFINRFNIVFKLVLFNYIYNNYDFIEVLDYVKDGVLFTGTPRLNPVSREVNDYIAQYFSFHNEHYDTYMRFNRTSLYFDNNQESVIVKGIYKNPPKNIEKYLLNILTTKDYYRDFPDIEYYANPTMFKVFSHLGVCREFYAFDNRQYIARNGKMVMNFKSAEPFAILYYFLYPILTLLRD